LNTVAGRRPCGLPAACRIAPQLPAGRRPGSGSNCPGSGLSRSAPTGSGTPNLTWVERNFGYAVARAYAGHTDSGSDTGATSTYVHASLAEVAATLATLTGDPHPLVVTEGDQVISHLALTHTGNTPSRE
jgi:hypothetical protein